MKLLSLFVAEAHYNALKKGFHDDDIKIGVELSAELKESHKNNILSKAVMLIITELAEAVEHARKGKWMSSNLNVKGTDITQDELYKETVEEEIADAMIRIFDLCGLFSIDIERVIDWKMKYNLTREYKHGKKF